MFAIVGKRPVWGCVYYGDDEVRMAVRVYDSKPVNWSEQDWLGFRAVAADFVLAVKAC